MKRVASVKRARRRGRAVARGGVSGAVNYASRITATGNEALEANADGAMQLDPTGAIGLRSVTDDAVITGYRYESLPYTDGAQVTFAQLRFTSRGNNSVEPCTVRIRAEAADDAAAFTSATGDISGRSLTSAFVDWTIPVWGVGQSNSDTRTPDLSAVVGEVVDRAGFAGSVAFVIQPAPGEPFVRRRPYGFEDDPDLSPQLIVNDIVEPPPPPPPPPPGGFSDGYDLFGLEGNEAFSTSSPTLKDGTAITGDMRTYHDGVVSCFILGNGVQDLASAFEGEHDSNKARGGQHAQDPILRVFRLTGDLRWLDYLCDGYDRLIDSTTNPKPMLNAWDGHDCSALNSSSVYTCPVSSGDPWGPGLKALSYKSGTLFGTDLIRLEQAKFWAIITEFTWALWLNRNKTSPANGAGFYQAIFDVWKVHVENFVTRWQGGSNVSTTFRTNYRGCDGVTNGTGGIIDNVPSGSAIRQADGVFPMFLRNEGHSGHNSVMLNYFLGRLGEAGAITLPNAGDAIIAAKQMAHAMRANSYKACTNSTHGDSLLSAQVRPFSDQSVHNIQRMTYAAHQGNTLISMWLTGAFRDRFTLTDMFKVGSAWSHAHFDTLTGRTYRDLLRSTNETLAPNACGFETVSSSSEQTATSAGREGTAGVAVVFDPGGSRVGTLADNIVTNVLGGYVNPEYGGIPSALFLREALLAVGDLE